jgi:hypothetical protein
MPGQKSCVAKEEDLGTMPEKHFLFNRFGYLQLMNTHDWPKKYQVGWGPCPARTPVWQKKKI